MPVRNEFRHVTIDPERDLLTRQELAWVMRVSRGYVDAACRWGFVMPGGTATLVEFRAWLVKNPEFRKGRAYAKRDLTTKGTENRNERN